MPQAIYINKLNLNRRIRTYIEQHCNISHITYFNSLDEYIRNHVPHIKKGNSHSTRYYYYEDAIGEAMHDWYVTIYPQLKNNLISQ